MKKHGKYIIFFKIDFELSEIADLCIILFQKYIIVNSKPIDIFIIIVEKIENISKFSYFTINFLNPIKINVKINDIKLMKIN